MRWGKLPFAVLVTLVGFGTVSCSDSAPNRSLAPNAPASLSSAVEEANQDQEVTGGVSFLIPEAPGVNTPARYEMAAISHRGIVKGELVVRFSRVTEQTLWGDIVCFSTAGKAAFLAARIRKSNVSFVPPGSYFAWTVVDNGEGKNSPPDLTSTFFTVSEALAQAHCANGGLNPALFPVEQGNLQVHRIH